MDEFTMPRVRKVEDLKYELPLIRNIVIPAVMSKLPEIVRESFLKLSSGECHHASSSLPRQIISQNPGILMQLLSYGDSTY